MDIPVTEYHLHEKQKKNVQKERSSQHYHDTLNVGGKPKLLVTAVHVPESSTLN